MGNNYNGQCEFGVIDPLTEIPSDMDAEVAALEGKLVKAGMKGLYNLPMSMTALDLSPEALKKYRPLDAIRKRRVEQSAAIASRRKRAMLAARKAAKLLKTEFGAKEVILFGSLARRASFSLHSDIDLAVRGIAPEKFYAAAAAIERVDVNFQFDLAELETCPPAVFKNIEKDGKPL